MTAFERYRAWQASGDATTHMTFPQWCTVHLPEGFSYDDTGHTVQVADGCGAEGCAVDLDVMVQSQEARAQLEFIRENGLALTSDLGRRS